MADLCPCCGHELPATVPAKALLSVPMPESERTITRLVCEAYPRAVATDTIVRHVWAHDAAGGPLQTANGISVRVHRLNKRLKPLGWRVVPSAGSWQGRRLEQIGVIPTINSIHRDGNKAGLAPSANGSGMGQISGR